MIEIVSQTYFCSCLKACRGRQTHDAPILRLNVHVTALIIHRKSEDFMLFMQIIHATPHGRLDGGALGFKRHEGKKTVAKEFNRLQVRLKATPERQKKTRSGVRKQRDPPLRRVAIFSAHNTRDGRKKQEVYFHGTTETRLVKTSGKVRRER